MLATICLASEQYRSMKSCGMCFMSCMLLRRSASLTILASRLSGAAQPGQILINQRLHAAVEDRVRAEPADPLTLKGFARPVNAWSVVSSG